MKSGKIKINPSNLKKEKVKIMVFGTFDILHPGHLNFFSQARKLATNPFLVVSVARDKNVKKIKGKLPLHSEKKRAKALRSVAGVDSVILGGLKNYLPHILEQQPKVIALGYDQKVYTTNLKKFLADKGSIVKIVRLKPFKRHIYRSSKIIKLLKPKKIG